MSFMMLPRAQFRESLSTSGLCAISHSEGESLVNFFFGTKQYRIIGSYFCLVYIVVLVQLVPTVCNGLYNSPVVRVVVLFIFFTLSSILAYPSLPLSTIDTVYPLT